MTSRSDLSRSFVTRTVCIVLALAPYAQGCSTATAAGCGVGIAAGVLLAGVAAAGAKDPSIDTGQVMLGGSMFGAASGCSGAAVAEVIAAPDRGADERDEHERNAQWREARISAREPERPAASSGSELITTQADLDGIKVYWLGLPRVDSRKVGLRFQRYGSQAVLADCEQVEITIDGASARYPLVRQTKPAASMLVETVQIETDIETVKAMRAAEKVEFGLCALQRRLTLAGAQAANDFVARFDALVPSPPAPESAAEPATEAVAPVAAPAPPAPAEPTAPPLQAAEP